MNFTERAAALVKGLSPLAKMYIPAELISLLLDMSKVLDQLNQEKKQ